MLLTKFRFIWPSGFTGEDFKKLANQKQELPVAAMPLKLFGQMNRNLVGSTYGRFCIKFPQSRMKGERHRLSPLSLKVPIAIANTEPSIGASHKIQPETRIAYGSHIC
jgi:hypothetical protein